MNKQFKIAAVLLLLATPAAATSPSSPHAESRIAEILGTLLAFQVTKSQKVNTHPKSDRLDQANRPRELQKKVDCAVSAANQDTELSDCLPKEK